ncbi:SUMF1/EgtB/PvdO family nonheme iron enzyme [Fischerella sp. PCC 9605]|uniref:SUMF1/EgtB/PvdO family nonheme iron enzyme n=1 Tax=Fischerella sp. PCC 9605 TaxID=1173024 RepID=UPI00047B47EE|nr:SUMF1/EgtB/PvdO family nonheme iron enzyme [Fischerella sp. PCC 9605]
MALNWAIAIGINQYNNLQPLNYAKLDALAMRDWFEKEAQFDRVFLFTEDSQSIPAFPASIPTQPTYGNLRRFLRANFEKPLLTSGDNFWFFFAGHGRREAERDYLMLVDSDPGDVEHTAIPVDFVTQRLRRSGADNVVLFLDACRDERNRLGEGIGCEHQGVVTFYSCSPHQTSYEIEQLQHGSFTQALLEGLRITGSGNCATVERLERYLQWRVPTINQQYRKIQQNPYATAEPAAKLHLILLPDYATLHDIATMKLDAYQAEVEGNWELARQLWIRVNVVARGSDMQVIQALLRIAQRQGQFSKSPEHITLIPEPVTLPTEDRSVASQSALTQQTELQDFRFDVVTVDISGRIVKREKGQAQYFTEDLGNGITLEMVAIPGGEFIMGSPESEGYDYEKPQHEVTLQPLFMGKYPVTQTQWQAVVELPKINRELKPNPSNFKGDNRPVEQVSWNDTLEFCARLSSYTRREYRLPSEAEWEYAARAGTTTPFHFGKTITTELANYDGNNTYALAPEGIYREQTTEVGNFPPNAFGLYDMHGNVWEWCGDRWHDSYKGAPVDGSAWVDKSNDHQARLLRGGSWYNDPEGCRSANRYNSDPDNWNNSIGFRVCISRKFINKESA